MMVTFVSQCEKKSLNKTRRVLDSFADRIGDRTWQTVITEEGLQAVKKLLRKTASKNTAVACHWIRSRSRSELVWIVGNRRKFNHDGVVPVNFTEDEIGLYMDRHKWQTIKIIEYASAIAGLFHDFGKATVLFAVKIDPRGKNTEKFEPYRHEWVSLRLFQAFVQEMKDQEWLERLSQVDRDEIPEYFKDGLDGGVDKNHPMKNLSPFAQLVAWLILTHHKLPLYPKWKKDKNSPPHFKNINDWFTNNFNAVWNSPVCDDPDQENRLKKNWEIVEAGLPYCSMHWRAQACFLASEAKFVLKQQQEQTKGGWLKGNLFTAHVSRLSLMLADHYYSAREKVTEEWRSPNYLVWANTNKAKQQLDEHLIGVSHFAKKIVKALPYLNSSLDSLEENQCLEKEVKKDKKLSEKEREIFGWQDKSKKIAEEVGKSTVEQGFFGINMASTGKGKTLANAKIMYAIGSETGRIRFSIALGLRTLTLQTGQEYRDMLELTNKELAIVVGGTAIKQLFENEQSKLQNTDQDVDEYEKSGSESREGLLESDLSIDFSGETITHSLVKWTKQEKNLNKLLNAPVLVSTIDHLMPASEGTKGGKQIAPMLRLMTSDLVLDEPDDFGLEDLPALCRLVHWAGMLGSRVLLSTATMPPVLANALFQAYQNGWQQYAKANVPGWDKKIICAWFDEFECRKDQLKEPERFKEAHKKFVEKRVKNLNANGSVKRKGKIINIERPESASTITCMAQTIQKGILDLHCVHNQHKDDKYISVGLVRMANIDPLAAVAMELLKIGVPDNNTSIYYCIYHSRYPLAIRSYMESKLDRILKRKEPEKTWKHPEISRKISNSPCQNHIFVVLASPVAEVGRDHDYDWAIVEPSSMRSIIQLAGRILRHRELMPSKPNILLLNENYRALIGETVCFEKPGFEMSNLQLSKHDLHNCLSKEQFERIDAVSRIVLPKKYSKEGDKYKNLVELEHKALAHTLFSGEKAAKVWWKSHPHWCGEVQRQQRFRKSLPDDVYCYWIADEYRKPTWKWKNESKNPARFGDLSDISIDEVKDIECAKGNGFWFELDAKRIYAQLADDLHIKSLEEISRRFGEVRLVEYGDQEQEYKYHPNLGLFKETGGR